MLFREFDQWKENLNILTNVNKSTCSLLSLPNPFRFTLIQSCPIEETVTTSNQILAWHSGSHYSVSKPLCKLQDHKILTRQCIAANWIPSATEISNVKCEPIIENEKFYCPLNFGISQDCVLVKDKQHYSVDVTYIDQRSNILGVSMRIFGCRRRCYIVKKNFIKFYQ